MQTQKLKTESGKGEETRDRWQDKAEGPISTIGSTLENTYQDAKEGASELFQKAKDTASDATKKVKNFGQQAVDETSQMIRSNPLPAVAIGFGLGLTVGLIAAKR